MKLINKTSKYYILFTLPILLFSAVFSYLFMLHEIGESNEALLTTRMQVVEQHLIENDTILLNIFKENREIFIKEIDATTVVSNQITDTLIYSEIQQEFVLNKMLQKKATIQGKNYLVKVWKSSMEYDEVLEVIITVFITILVLLLLTILFINIRISKLIWHPFFETVLKIKDFKVTNGQPLSFHKTSIAEFEELNKSIQNMTEKMILDYNNQKKFSENASHEFQTPLAIIKSKIDLLMQSHNLSENEYNLLGAIDDAINRLSRINKSLLLLSKIENNQFEVSQKIKIKPIIEKILLNNEHFINEKELRINNAVTDTFFIQINEELGYVMVNNLIQNAIRHNKIGGELIVFNEDNAIIIGNDGDEKPLNEQLIYERFQKISNDSNSIGLGLSIVKEIAQLNAIQITYYYENGKHYFKLLQNTELQ